ncbi:MAG TPA: hypothetical protein VGH98_21350 [Gemmatimonadaceae bacterium]|jgi:hypothetical protein
MPVVSRRLTRALTLTGLVASAACYAYVPARSDASLTDREVHLTLSDSGAVVLAAQVGPQIASLDGRFIRDSDDVYLLSVTQTDRRDGSQMEWRGERLAVPRVLITGVATKQFSRGRTFLFGALTTGALIGIAEAFAGGGGATVPGGTPGGPQGGK